MSPFNSRFLSIYEHFHLGSALTNFENEMVTSLPGKGIGKGPNFWGLLTLVNFPSRIQYLKKPRGGHFFKRGKSLKRANFVQYFFSEDGVYACDVHNIPSEGFETFLLSQCKSSSHIFEVHIIWRPSFLQFKRFHHAVYLYFQLEHVKPQVHQHHGTGARTQTLITISLYKLAIEARTWRTPVPAMPKVDCHKKKFASRTSPIKWSRLPSCFIVEPEVQSTTMSTVARVHAIAFYYQRRHGEHAL
jgi:hypothetical protein